MTKVARFGLVARAGFYLLLAGLVVQLAANGGGGRQADAKGALETITGNPLGEAVLVAVAVGFIGCGVARLWGAWRDDRPGGWRRASTALQGAFYLVLMWIPLSYVLGNRQVGSNKSQHRVAGDLLGLPAGREIVAALGLVVIGVCVNQIRMAVAQEYADGLQLRGEPTWVKRLVHVAARLGIPARALVFGPVGICLIIAAVQSDRSHAEGLDQLLSRLAGEWWGVVVLAVVAFGLVVFATYTLLEAKYRKVLRGE
jgi:hypothetical protein